MVGSYTDRLLKRFSTEGVTLHSLIRPEDTIRTLIRPESFDERHLICEGDLFFFREPFSGFYATSKGPSDDISLTLKVNNLLNSFCDVTICDVMIRILSFLIFVDHLVSLRKIYKKYVTLD